MCSPSLRLQTLWHACFSFLIECLCSFWRKNMPQHFRWFLQLLSKCEGGKADDLFRPWQKENSATDQLWKDQEMIHCQRKNWDQVLGLRVSTLQCFSRQFQIYPVLTWCSCLWLFLDRCFSASESCGSDPMTHVALVWVIHWHSDTAFSSGSLCLSLRCSCLSFSCSLNCILPHFFQLISFGSYCEFAGRKPSNDLNIESIQ